MVRACAKVVMAEPAAMVELNVSPLMVTLTNVLLVPSAGLPKSRLREAEAEPPAALGTTARRRLSAVLMEAVPAPPEINKLSPLRTAV